MRLIITLTLLFCMHIGYSQMLSFKPDSTLQKVDDTLFMTREFEGDPKEYHAVYIEKNRKSKAYKWLMGFSFNTWDKDAFKNGIQCLKEKSGIKKLKKHNMSGLPRNWLPVYYYNKNYFLYLPNDYGGAGKRILSDSVLIDWNMDGPYPQEIQSVTKENSSTHIVKYKSPGADKKISTVVIHIIDPKIKLAVWEYKHEDGSPSSYSLYIPAAAAPNLNAVVNYTQFTKAREFEFQEPDYQKLLKMK